MTNESSMEAMGETNIKAQLDLVALADTALATPAAIADTLNATSGERIAAQSATTTQVRTTVLPRDVGTSGATGEPTARYETHKILGVGGVGEVALAQDHDIARPVAVKRLRTDRRDETSLLRFADEVRMIGQLEHPGIVPVHDVGVDNEGQHYLVMKYIAGETLETVIEKLCEGVPEYMERFNHEHRARICLAILEAIGHAHKRGIIHRDLKPANIMVGPQGEVTVMDWGLAKPIEQQERVITIKDFPQPIEARRMLETQAGSLLGTPLYMSPEQAAGQNDSLDTRTDVYSLALIFWELFTLQHPRKHLGSSVAVLLAVLTEDLNSQKLTLDSFKTSTPCEYRWWILPGLSRDPAGRYADANVMAEALERVLDGAIPVQCPISLTKRGLQEFDQWINRHPWIFNITFLLLTVLAFVGLGTLAYQLIQIVT